MKMNNLLKRESWHALGGFVVGLAAWFFGSRWIMAAVLLIIAFKEVFIDPHPPPFYWAKSALDMAIWTALAVGGYKLGKRVK